MTQILRNNVQGGTINEIQYWYWTDIIYSLDNPQNHLAELSPPHHAVTCDSNPRDVNIFLAGCINGQVSFFFAQHNTRRIMNKTKKYFSCVGGMTD